MFPPYLCPYICRVFHAKFQDSRTNNKKSTQSSDPKRPLAIYATVCKIYSTVVSKLTNPGKIISEKSATHYAKDHIKFEFGNTPYLMMSKMLEELRTKLKRPGDHSTTFGISTQLQQMQNTLTKMSKERTRDKNDLRNLQDGRRGL